MRIEVRTQLVAGYSTVTFILYNLSFNNNYKLEQQHRFASSINPLNGIELSGGRGLQLECAHLKLQSL